MRTLLFLFLTIGLLSTSVAQVPLSIDSEGVLDKSVYDALIKKHNLTTLSSYDTLCDSPLAVRALFIKDNKFGFLDEYGEVVTDKLYDKIIGLGPHEKSRFVQNSRFYGVVLNKKWGVVNLFGKEVIPVEHSYGLNIDNKDSVWGIWDGDSTRDVYISKDEKVLDYKYSPVYWPYHALRAELNSKRKQYEYNQFSIDSYEDSIVLKIEITSSLDTLVHSIKINGANESLKPTQRVNSITKKDEWVTGIERVLNAEWIEFQIYKEYRSLHGVYSISQNKIIVPAKYDGCQFLDTGITGYVSNYRDNKYVEGKPRELSVLYDYKGSVKLEWKNKGVGKHYFELWEDSVILDYFIVSEYDTIVEQRWKTISYEYLDCNFKPMIPCTIKRLPPKGDFIIIAQNATDDEKYGAFNLKGELLLDFIYDEIDIFNRKSRTKQLFRAYKDGNLFIFDLNGQLVLEPEYGDIINVYDGMKKGEWCLSRGPSSLYNGYFGDRYYFSENNKWGLLDSSFNILIPAVYDKIGEASIENGLWYVEQGKSIGVFDVLNGSVIIPIKYDKIEYYQIGYKVTVDEKYGLLSRTGKVLIPIEKPKEFYFKKIYSGMWYEILLDNNGRPILSDSVNVQNMYGDRVSVPNLFK